jgi:hypothetical protein
MPFHRGLHAQRRKASARELQQSPALSARSAMLKASTGVQ